MIPPKTFMARSCAYFTLVVILTDLPAFLVQVDSAVDAKAALRASKRERGLARPP